MENQEQQPIQPQIPVQPVSQPIQSPEPKKSFPKWKLILSLVVILVLVGNVSLGLFLMNRNSKPQVACTMEAKICPDGSSVGRIGPKCEFSPCPKTSTPTPDSTANWKTEEAVGQPFSFKYPVDWNVKQDSNDNSPYMFHLINPNNKDETISLILYSTSIDKRKVFLNGSDAGFSTSSTIENTTFQGKDIIKATTTASELDHNTSKAVPYAHLYSILVPVGNNTLEISGDISYKSLLEQVLSTIKFTQ
jgi:hypothetical protein